MYYYRARYYDPLNGRFLVEDPVKFASGDSNFYRYVQNNPVNFVDPFGLNPLLSRLFKEGLKQLGKLLTKKIGRTEIEAPEEDDDGDGIPNFMDPDSSLCLVNCDQPEKDGNNNNGGCP